MPEAVPVTTPTGANGAPAKPTGRISRRAQDPTADVPIPTAEVSSEVSTTVPTEVVPASEETPPAAEELAAEPPKEEPKPTESAMARSLRRREAKLEADKKAARESVDQANQRLQQAETAVTEARQFGERMQQREAGFVAAIKRDPVTVLEQLGITKRELAEALMGKVKAPVDDAARSRVEQLERQVQALSQGLQTRDTSAAQQQAERTALSIVQTDPAYSHLAALAKHQGGQEYVISELNEAAAKLLAAGQRLPLQEIVAAVERKHASLARVYGGSVTPAAAGHTAPSANRTGQPGARPSGESNPPTLSSRQAGERASGTLDPIADEAQINALAIQNADAARRSRTPKK